MTEDLRSILTSYKEFTLKIIETVKRDNFDSLQTLIDDRQSLLDKALNISYNKEELQQIYKELNLDEIQEQLNTLMKGKLSYIRSEMEKIAKNKRANSMYNKHTFDNSHIFSKKI